MSAPAAQSVRSSRSDLNQSVSLSGAAFISEAKDLLLCSPVQGSTSVVLGAPSISRLLRNG